jgi:hypothetical protein
MEELMSRALEQNFVPVVDGRGAFVGIVRRRSVLEYFADRALSPEQHRVHSVMLAARRRAR